MKKLPPSLLLLVIFFCTISAQTPANSDISQLKIPTNQSLIFTNDQSEFLNEINLLRRNPKGYVKFLEEVLKTFRGKTFETIDGVDLVSDEGKKPVEEAIKILKNLRPLSEVEIANGLMKAAQDHVKDLEKHNKTGHKGTDGSLPTERGNRYGSALDGVSENIMYKIGSPRDMVLMMLIDDGNPKRSHRKEILDPQLKKIGFAIGENKAGGKFCVLKMATMYYEKLN